MHVWLLQLDWFAQIRSWPWQWIPNDIQDDRRGRTNVQHVPNERLEKINSDFYLLFFGIHFAFSFVDTPQNLLTYLIIYLMYLSIYLKKNEVYFYVKIFNPNLSFLFQSYIFPVLAKGIRDKHLISYSVI